MTLQFPAQSWSNQNRYVKSWKLGGQIMWRTRSRDILNLLELDTSIPNHDVGSDTVLTVVKEDNHGLGVHGLASVEVKILEVGTELSNEVLLGLALPRLDLVLGLASLGQLALDGLEVVWRGNTLVK